MGRLLGLIAKLLAIVGVAAVARPRRVDVPGEERAIDARLPSPAEAAEAHERATHSPPPPGWGRPQPASTPQPTYWPSVLALGATFFAWGLISNPFMLLGGLLLFLIAAAGWIGELLDEFA